MGGVRRVAVAGVLVLCGLVGGLVFGGASAWAALEFSLERQLTPSGGQFGKLDVGSVAVDGGDGDTYVADSAAGVVDVFDTASGAQLASLDSALTPAKWPGEDPLAVAANDGTGRVYVLDPAHNVVDVFDSAGGYVCQITGSATPSASECDAAGSATPAGGFEAPGGITVDQATGKKHGQRRGKRK